MQFDTLRPRALLVPVVLGLALASNVSSGAPPAPTSHPGIPPSPPKVEAAPLSGWADLHAHPLSYLGFAGKLIAGGVDVGSYLPADAQCHTAVNATSMEQALGNDNAIHGGWGAFDNRCGDALRPQVIHGLEDANHALHTADGAHGASDFAVWPAWNDITHQKMWFEWIRRARDGGQRVMVALAVNNKTLADAVAGPGDLPTDDRTSADFQLQKTKEFVARHADFMEIAYTPADLARIARSNRIAVVLGVEIDNIGNFNRPPAPTPAMVTAEIDRLYAEGVRYVFPIHVVDNAFGGTAIYTDGFALSNYREAGHFWDIECANPADGIHYVFRPAGFDLALAAVKQVKLGIDGLRNPPTPPTCPGSGHQNRLGLTALGDHAVKEMMRHGMMIDIDHMSQKAANRTLDIAEQVPRGRYPLVSGHNGVRGVSGTSENARTLAQLRRIYALEGMFGLGSAEGDAYQWVQNYAQVVQQAMPGNGAVAMGTDLNGLVPGPAPRKNAAVVYDASFPMSKLGQRSWNYNKDGVAHYGMLADFLRDARTAPAGTIMVDQYLSRSADRFLHMWERCEAQKAHVGP